MPQVKIAPVATSKSTICCCFCPHYKQTTRWAWVNLAADLGGSMFCLCLTEGLHHYYWCYEWGSLAGAQCSPTPWTLAASRSWQVTARCQPSPLRAWLVCFFNAFVFLGHAASPPDLKQTPKCFQMFIQPELMKEILKFEFYPQIKPCAQLRKQ